MDASIESSVRKRGFIPLEAIIGAMITMYSSFANRTCEIGTLRALGFQRGSILAALPMESLLLGLVGGCIGFFCLVSTTLHPFHAQLRTPSELAFSFTLTP